MNLMRSRVEFSMYLVSRAATMSSTWSISKPSFFARMVGCCSADICIQLADGISSKSSLVLFPVGLGVSPFGLRGLSVPRREGGCALFGGVLGRLNSVILSGGTLPLGPFGLGETSGSISTVYSGWVLLFSRF